MLLERPLEIARNFNMFSYIERVFVRLNYLPYQNKNGITLIECNAVIVTAIKLGNYYYAAFLAISAQLSAHLRQTSAHSCISKIGSQLLAHASHTLAQALQIA